MPSVPSWEIANRGIIGEHCRGRDGQSERCRVVGIQEMRHHGEIERGPEGDPHRDVAVRLTRVGVDVRTLRGACGDVQILSLEEIRVRQTNLSLIGPLQGRSVAALRLRLGVAKKKRSRTRRRLASRFGRDRTGAVDLVLPAADERGQRGPGGVSDLPLIEVLGG